MDAGIEDSPATIPTTNTTTDGGTTSTIKNKDAATNNVGPVNAVPAVAMGSSPGRGGDRDILVVKNGAIHGAGLPAVVDLNQNCADVAKVLKEADSVGTQDTIITLSEGKKRAWVEKLLQESGGGDKPIEEDLLKKLEEANRLLEADTKSFPSLSAYSGTPSHSRKSSGSSIISSTSCNSHYSAQNSNESEDPNSVNDNAQHKSKHVFKRLKRGKGGGDVLRTVQTSSKSAKTMRRNSSSPPRTLATSSKLSALSSSLSSLSSVTTVVETNTSSQSMTESLSIDNINDDGQCRDGGKGQNLQRKHTPQPQQQAKVRYQSAMSRLPLEAVFQINVAAVSSSETLWEIWGRIINDWDSVRKKPAFLKDLIRKGIPHEFRGMAWQLILGVHDAVWKQEYAEHMKKTSPCEKLIRRDIARTFPDHEFFKEKDGFGQESLFNVMKAYSLHDREVGYCQGSGFIVGMLLMQMPEEDAFAVLMRLMQDFRLRELFKPTMAELGLCMFKLECLIQELLPTLLVHFQTQNFDTSMYASSWFLTLYVTSLPLSLARRIMDMFVSEGMEIIFRVGVAILQSCQEDLLALDMEGLLMYLQKDLRGRFEQESDQDNLMQTAFGIKYSHKKMKKLEKEYTALKSKENEDQIEMRRLRTENRLLRQRIDNLEKESATLADHLVQDQVTRAQEAEEVYILKNELSVTKQQLRDTQNKLMDAQDIIGDIKKRTRIIEDAVYLDQGEEQNMVKHLQEELIAVRLRETETADIIKGLKNKIADLEDTNQRLQRAPSNDVQQLQEELIAVKLREAEANLSLKELKMKVNDIEKYWEAHIERMRQMSPKDKGSKAELRQLQEEVMTVKTKEAKALVDLKEVKQKLMEMETQNHIVTNQIRRMDEDNKEVKRQLEEAGEREKDLKTNLKDLTRKLDDTESKRKEEGMMSRILEAESDQQLAELRHKIAQVDIQKEELLAACKLFDKGGNHEMENRVFDLQDEIVRLKVATARHKFRAGGSLMTDSYLGNNSDEEVDAEINDSKNLDKTLSDIIEGRSPARQAPVTGLDASNNHDTSSSFLESSGVTGSDDDSGNAENSSRLSHDQNNSTDGANTSLHHVTLNQTNLDPSETLDSEGITLTTETSTTVISDCDSTTSSGHECDQPTGSDNMDNPHDELV